MARWFLPDVAMAVACVTLFYSLFLFQGYRSFFRDSDAGWHIRSGETMLRTLRLPRSDPYSFTRLRTPWFAWEWAADAATGAVHMAGGLGGVALFYGVAIAVGAWLWFRLHWAMGGDFLLACAMAPLMLSTCSLHWLARPHVIGWLFLLGAVWYAEIRGRGENPWGQTAPSTRPDEAERSREEACGLVTESSVPGFSQSFSTAGFGWRDAAFIAAFTALWANVHASFFLAPVVALIYGGGAAVRRALWGSADGAGASWYLRAAAVAAAAGLANPYGLGLYRHVFDYLRDSELLGRIGEFQSFDFHAAGSGQIVAALAIGMGGGVLALGRRRPEHFALAVLFTVLALRSARGLPIAALVLLPVANGAIADALKGAASGLTGKWRRGLQTYLAYSGRLRMWDRQFRGLALAPLMVCLCWGILRTPAMRAATGFPADQFPVAAYSHIPEGARLFATDKFGGYLIYRSAGVRKVFFDGRSDLYGAEFLKRYGRMVQVRPGWREIWDGYGFTHALLPTDAPLAAALQQTGWQTVYRDGTAVLLSAGGVW